MGLPVRVTRVAQLQLQLPFSAAKSACAAVIDIVCINIFKLSAEMALNIVCINFSTTAK